ncbi:MAG: oxidoreductase [Ferrovibrio sp.]|nr:MAG: oxidoreductase [Ferrovibrio sp.]
MNHPAEKMSQNAMRLAVVGCGYWGKNLVRNFAALGVLAGVCDANAEQAAAMAAQFNAMTMDFDTLLGNAEIQAVVIAAPAAMHYRLARQALTAGKHVFVEKPLALNVDEAMELCRLAENHRLILMVGHLLHYHPAFLRLKQLVADGGIGRLQYLYSNRLNLGKVRREENALWSFAPHDISMILALVGSEPDDVTAVGGAYLNRQVADVTTSHLSFPGGERAHVFVSWLHPFKEQKLVVVGERGMAVFDDGEPWDRKLLLYPHEIQWKDGVPVPNKATGQPIPLDESEPLKLECQHFIDCICTSSPPRTDGWEGVRVLKVLQRAQMAMDKPVRTTNQPVFPGATVHESAYVDQPTTIGDGTKIWHFSHILGHTDIGRNCVIGQNVTIGPHVVVGNNCKIQNNVSIYKGVRLEDGVFCGPSCVFTNVNNPRAEIERKDEFRQTLVKRGATIGANATVVCGHTLGEYCFIAAGAVVTSDVPPHALMAGVPARQIGWMSHDGEKLGPDMTCPRSGRCYREAAGRLEEVAAQAS